VTISDKHAWIGDALARHEAPLVRYAYRLLGNHDTARDVVQDCFLRLCRQDPKMLGAHLRQWLFTVCRNRAMDHLRKDGRMDALGETEVAAQTSEPSRHVEELEEHGRVLDSIGRLPDRQREVLHLKFREGMSYKQIGEICDLSVSNVGWLLHSAIKTLRDQLGDQSAARGRSAS
jgi:RNA polymerase sigma-70 factor (ECF subfamily)